MSQLLAIDAGGTTTRAVIVEPSGRCLGLGLATGGNPISGGSEAAMASLAAATERALRAAGPEAGDLRSAVIALAGSGVEAPGSLVGEILAPLGLHGPAEIVSDLLATYSSGTLLPDGYLLVAGTGAASGRVEGGRLAAVSDGLGWLLGDAGSGYWIGHRVATAVTAHLDGRGPETALTALLLARLGLEPTTELREGRPAVLLHLLDALYALRPVELSRFSPLAFAAHDDEVARGILDQAASQLAATLASVARPGVEGPLVLGGGIANRDVIAARLRHTGPVVTVADGVVGAAVLALRGAGIRVDDAVFRRLRDGVSALREVAAT